MKYRLVEVPLERNVVRSLQGIASAGGTVSLSPAEFPVAVRISLDDANMSVVIEFVYMIAPSEPTEEESVGREMSVSIGRSSGRVFRVAIPLTKVLEEIREVFKAIVDERSGDRLPTRPPIPPWLLAHYDVMSDQIAPFVAEQVESLNREERRSVS